MKKSKGKWTKKRGGFLGFEMPSLPSLNLFSYFSSSEEPAKASNQTATGTNQASSTKQATQSSGANQATGATQTNNTLGGSRRKRKTKKSKK